MVAPSGTTIAALASFVSATWMSAFSSVRVPEDPVGVHSQPSPDAACVELLMTMGSLTVVAQASEAVDASAHSVNVPINNAERIFDFLPCGMEIFVKFMPHLRCLLPRFLYCNFFRGGVRLLGRDLSME